MSPSPGLPAEPLGTDTTLVAPDARNDNASNSPSVMTRVSDADRALRQSSFQKHSAEPLGSIQNVFVTWSASRISRRTFRNDETPFCRYSNARFSPSRHDAHLRRHLARDFANGLEPLCVLDGELQLRQHF